MRLSGSALLVLSTLFATSCASTSPSACCASCEKAQAVVASVAKQNPDCTRLTLHCSMQGGAKGCASTDAARIGKPSDKEDLEAMQTGKTIVLEEAGALDVTVPINNKDGKFQSACGVTLKPAGMTREQLTAKATKIAKAVEVGLGGACDCTCK